MPEPIPQFTPVNLITGFLGSGKTTLLQRLLTDPALAETAVLINEFGEVGLDHHLLGRIDEHIVLLQSGCLCCTIRGELADAVHDLHSKRDRGLISPFQRLVIESTGLADPFPVLTTIHADPVLKHHFRLSNVIATADAVNGCDQLARHPESVKQIAVADRIVLTKTDIANSAAIEARIRAINPAAPILRAAEDMVDAKLLLGDDVLELAGKEAPFHAGMDGEIDEHAASYERHPHANDPNRHGENIRAFALKFDRPLDWTAFGIWLTMLLNRHGDAVLRVKGILDVAGSQAPVAIHGVQHLVHPPVHMPAWPDAERCSRIVFIVQGLEREAVEQSLATFAALGVEMAG